MITPEDERKIEEIVADKIDLMSAFRDLPDDAREEIARDIEGFLTSRQMALRKPENTYTPRITVSGADINLDAAGAGKGHLGPTLPRWIDFVGASGYLDADGQMVHVRSAGGGADCMFDSLSSPCWATEVAAGRGTEGQTMTSLSGCTFKMYSTVKAAAAQADIDFPTGGSVVAICGGTYLENNIVVTNDQTWIGASRETVIIGSVADSLTTATVAMSGAAVLSLYRLTVRASTGTGSTKGGIQCDGFSKLYAADSTFKGGASGTANSARSAIVINTAAMPEFDNCDFDAFNGINSNTVGERAHNCRFTATGTAVAIRGSIDHKVKNCEFSGPAYGIYGISDRAEIVGNLFATTTAGIAQLAAGHIRSCTIKGNTFGNNDHSPTTGVDLSLVDSTLANSDDNDIQDNKFYGVTTPIAFTSIGSTWRAFSALIADNTTNGSTWYSGDIPPGVRWINNQTVDGTLFGTNFNNGVIGLIGTNATTPLKISWPAFSLFNGTQINVAAGSFTYSSGSQTYYVSVSAAGTVTANATGTFTAGDLPLATVTTVGVAITAITYNDVILRMPAGGGAAASASEPYVTIGNTAGLSAERALTAGAGISIVDGGANSTVTISATGAATQEIKQVTISLGFSATGVTV